MNADERFMNEALELAARGIGAVEPNPPVGAVIVRGEEVIGRGRHKAFGGPHAEIEALADCRAQGHDATGATIYVTLEPCCHHGKTPPCTDAIVEAGIARVVAATGDPASHTDRRGADVLRAAGVRVEIGVCEKAAKRLIAPFAKYATTGRPWVIVKWAQSLDGKLAWREGLGRRWISNELCRADVHATRRRVGAVLVSAETVIADDPLLTPRPSEGRKPLRAVVDSRLRTPPTARLLNTPEDGEVVIFTTTDAMNANAAGAGELQGLGAELVEVPLCGTFCELAAVIDELGKRGVQQVLVEPGPGLLAAVLGAKLADELHIYIAAMILGGRGTAELSESLASLTEEMELGEVETITLGDDIRIIARLSHT